ncbi:MAG: TonB-dependent receptor [Pseudomonadales bacterium]
MRHFVKCALVGVLASAGASEVLAAAGGTIEEIVVTATYRETNLMETPQAISVADGELIESLGVTDMKQLVQYIPGLNMEEGGDGGGTGTTRYIIRGVESQQGTLSYEPSFSGVSVYMNDVPVTSAQGPARQVGGNLFDIQRVEVLKGPQGTLFGEGSVGGTIRFIYNEPDTSAFDFKVTASGSSIDEADDMSHRIDAVVNVPISDSVAVRVMGFDVQEAGWIDRTSQNRKDVNESSAKGMRIATLWNVNDDVTARLWWFHAESDTDGSILAQKPYEEYLLTTLPGTKAESFDDQDIFSLELDWDLGFATLYSRTAYFDRETVSRSETTALVAGVFDNFIGNIILSQNPELSANYVPPPADPLIPGTNLTHFQRDDTAATERWSQEFRLISNGTGKLSWTVGAFWKDSDDLRDNFQPIGYAKPQFEPLFAPYFSDPSNNRDDNLEELSGFGEVSYAFTDHWEAAFGARVSRLKQDFQRVENGTNDTFFTPSFKLSWRPTDWALYYFNFGTGFRPGNVNFGQEFNQRQYLAAGDNVIEPPGFNPSGLTGNEAAEYVNGIIYYDGDEVANYELGAKLMLLEDTLQLTAAAYYFDWKDIIQRFQDPVIPSTNKYYSQNAGDAYSRGFEVEMTYLIGDAWRFRFGGDINNAELSDDVPAPGVAKGNQLTFAPEWSITAGVDYSFDITASLRGNVLLTHQRIAKQYQDAANLIEIPEREVTNLRASILSADNHWRATLFADNLTNEDEVIRDNTYLGQPFFVFQKPRTLGLEVSYEM